MEFRSVRMNSYVLLFPSRSTTVNFNGRPLDGMYDPSRNSVTRNLGDVGKRNGMGMSDRSTVLLSADLANWDICSIAS